MITKNSDPIGRILVAEDNPLNQKVISHLLELWGCSYLLVASGHEALAALREYKFSLILMDFQMPGLDGYEVTKIIRRSTSLNNEIPVIALAANALQGDEQKCLQVGMNEFVTKPIDKRVLFEILRKYLGSSIESTSSLIDMTVITKLDKLDMVGESDIVVDLINSFTLTCSERLGRILHLYSQNEIAALSKEAHSLKSSARVLGAKRLADICQAIENLAHSNATMAPSALLSDFSEVLEKSLQELGKIRASRLNPGKST